MEGGNQCREELMVLTGRVAVNIWSTAGQHLVDGWSTNIWSMAGQHLANCPTAMSPHPFTLSLVCGCKRADAGGRQ
jgi:hypothetical protein